MKTGLSDMIPRDIVTELDKYIIGQTKAKKAVAIALRNRIRRSKLSEEIRDEVAPRNIIMIGPTGVGKTEIARRLAKLAGAPFLKVEATKFTEVGYVGRDVESMVRDLMSSAISMVKSEMRGDVEPAAREAAEEELLDLLLPGSGKRKAEKRHAGQGGFPGIQIGAITLGPNGIQSAGTTPPIGFSQEEEKREELPPPEDEEKASRKAHLRETFREKLRAGELEDKMIEITVSKQSGGTLNMFAGAGGMESMDINMDALSSLFGGGGGKKKKKVTVREARELLLAEHIDRMIDTESAVDQARDLVQNMGIIFIDEMDKIASREGASRGGQDVSREGVQRDILPIVEGSTVNTRYGMIDTSHILFIAAGAFNLAKPSDLIPELQGRFPLRVELEDLDADAFEQILTSPRNALTKQYAALMKTEDVELVFTDAAIRRMAELAAEVNRKAENIGARRLHTIMELLVEDISFDAADYAGQRVEITPEMVNEKLADVVEDQDLSRYIL